MAQAGGVVEAACIEPASERKNAKKIQILRARVVAHHLPDRLGLRVGRQIVRMPPKNFQVTFGDDQLADLGVKGAGSDGDSDRNISQASPGSLLNRLNPLKSLDAEGRKDFVKCYRALQPARQPDLVSFHRTDLLGINGLDECQGQLLGLRPKVWMSANQGQQNLL